MYKFSAPMPYEKESINKLIAINKQVEKSKITSLYFALPSYCELFTGFEQYRNTTTNKQNWDYWKYLIEHSLNSGCDLIYLLNNPARINIETPQFLLQLEKLDKLLFELDKMGVNKLRVCHHKLLSYLNKHYSNFQLYSSTSFEYKMTAEYKNFMFVHPYIKQIVPSHDTNKNFTLLKNLKKLLPNVEIELIVNEGCFNGCPVRNGHSTDFLDRHIEINNDDTLSNFYYTKFFCIKIEHNEPMLCITKSNNIYPWEIKEYSKIGINNFKLVGRDGYWNRISEYLSDFLIYLKTIDNIDFSNSIPINKYIHHLAGNFALSKLNTEEIKKFLPKINHFKKYGHLCASRCGVECRYCYNCAEKIQKVYEKKQAEQRKRNIPVCFVN